jgi:TM2 domain-containing membrane protein YozV
MDSQTRGAHEKYCFECGATIRINAEICPHCGVRQMPPPGTQFPVQQHQFFAPAPNGKNKGVAALFGILLGAFGVHKFYLGQPGMGILYLLLFWTGIPSIVGLVEGIIYLTMSDQEFTYKYGYH